MNATLDTNAVRFICYNHGVREKTATERDMAIARARVEARAKLTGPEEGDFIKLHNGGYTRISHVWEDSVQTSGGGDFYIGKGGGCSFSGTLYPGVARDALVASDETRAGDCWFFHHDYTEAHCGTYFELPFRVWHLKPGTDDSRASHF